MRIVMALFVMALSSVGCAGGAAGPSVTPAPTLTPVIPTTAPATSTPVAAPTIQPTETAQMPDLTGEVPEDVLLPMLQQVSDATGVALPDLIIEQARAVTWSDGSLGCPEPGMMYTQALVDGFLVVVEAAGETYDIHASQSGPFIVCPPGRSKPPIEP